ncbi:hypothetical protein [Streptosporangium sp. NPDC049376]|uniref:hypothetical protein n=1 Tax=Streptosporangium sp. NPDC049376 TaxID=3366192 RepID=UPI003796A4D6
MSRTSAPRTNRGQPYERITMPMRTYAWEVDANGEFDGERADAASRAHAAALPAAYKKADPGTVTLSRLDASALTGPVPLPAPDAPELSNDVPGSGGCAKDVGMW